jgi:hypothetical protein
VTFVSPWLLLALVALPLLWWLLRVLPPSPRVIVFPAVRLLLGLPNTSQTAARTPPWLLILRLAAAALVIVGLARPMLRSGADLPGRGKLLLVVDDGWASASDWPARLRAAQALLAHAGAAGRLVALLATAPDSGGAPPAATPFMPAAELAPRVAVLRPKPWPVDRAAAATALQAWHGSAAYLADGLTDGAGWPTFRDALQAAGPLLVIADQAPPAKLLLPATPATDGLMIRAARAAAGLPERIDVLARTGDGRTVARQAVPLAAGQTSGEAMLRLPAELRNQIDRLELDPTPGGVPGAGGVVLLDESVRRRPLGLLTGDAAADTPLSGANYYLKRAMAPYAEIREGNLDTLLSRPLSMLVLSDHPLAPGPEADTVRRWVEQGGLLLRFAGPATAQDSADGQPDPLLPVPLLAFERELGGAMSWAAPAGLAAFTAPSPFLGLKIPDEVRVSRQVLADPAADLSRATWARLADGTPLVTQRPLGAGRIVLVHVTASADWSNLPLSGLFVDMLRRLLALSGGVAADLSNAGTAPLVPAAILDGDGVLGSPPPGASAIPADKFATTAVSPAHPPGLYGPESGRRALNLAANLDLPEAAPAIPGAAIQAVTANARDFAFGPWLLALAIALLVAPARAADMAADNPALTTRLAYVQTGDPALDDVSRAGLEGLSVFVNSRTAAVLGEPQAVTPGQDDLSFYPLLYWPISSDATPPSAAAVAALNDYTAHGGIIVIDTRDGGGGGADMTPGTRAVLHQLVQDGAGGLAVPPLAPLTNQHVLARAFYLLSDFPGRYAGDTVWVGRDQDRTNDSVSPVIVGSDDWAAAWAVDADGRHPYATLPGGERQRTLAYRFGVNLVMYALTGNYKGDQVHVPALLERLGQ